MDPKDPKGYYEILELSVTASAAAVKAAYRRRAMELHPDRNKSKNATDHFQKLNEAFGVLNDPSARAQYDTLTVETSNRKNNEPQAPLEPVVCSVCAKVTAQPRYVIFYEVKSFLFTTIRTPLQGIFCSTCAERKALRATTVTWLLGWWGFPWGLIYSPHAIFINLAGGVRPHDINARLAARQAWVFGVLGKLDIARAIALDALDLAQKYKPKHVADEQRRRGFGYDADHEGAKLRKDISELLSSLGATGDGIRLRNSWALFRRQFYLQGLIGLTVVGLVSFWINTDAPFAPPRGPKPYAPNPPNSPPSAISPEPKPYVPPEVKSRVANSDPKRDLPSPELNRYVPHPEPPVLARPTYIRPAVAPNGHPWPTAAGYVSGYRKLHTDGHSTVTVDNSRNDSDVFVKLVSLDRAQAYPVRNFFIPRNGSFTLENLKAGNYDIRYRDLNTGGLSRSDSFTLEQHRREGGIEYSIMTLTLYKVMNGNMKAFGLAEDEF